MPKGDRRQHEPVQRRGRETRVIKERDREMRAREDQPVLAAGHLGPGEDYHIEDLREDQRGDGEIDVAQTGGEIGDEQCRARRPAESEQNGEPQIGRADDQERRCRAIHAQSEEGRMPEGDHAGIADEDVGRHRKQAPDQDLSEETPPIFG
jgi:hypothetical protein